MATRGCAVLSAVFVLLLVVLISLDSAMRNLDQGAIRGVVEVSEILLAALVFLAMPIGQQTGSHISLMLVTRLMPAPVARVVRSIGLGIVVALMVIMAILAWESLYDSYVTGEFRYGLLRVPIWPARLAIAIGFTLLALETAFSLSDSLRGRPDRQQDEGEMEGVD